MTTTRKQGRPKSEEKYRLILDAASCLFLQEGFANTSMDTVAKASGVSKQTVYSHFESKDTLFQHAITSKCRSYQLDTQQLLEVYSGDMSFRQCMQKIGGQFVRLLQDPQAVAMFRVVIAEAVNNHHVATLFYQAGPSASLATLSDVVEKYAEGNMQPEQAKELALDFCSLLKGEFHTMTLCGIQSALSEEEIARHVSKAVEKIDLLFNYYLSQH